MSSKDLSGTSLSSPIEQTTAEQYASFVGVQADDVEKQERIRTEPTLQVELANFTRKWCAQPHSVIRPVHAKFLSLYFPQFLMAYKNLPTHPKSASRSLVHSYSKLWFYLNGQPLISHYLIHHVEGTQVIEILLARLVSFPLSYVTSPTAQSIELLYHVVTLFNVTFFTYFLHTPASLAEVPRLPSVLASSSHLQPFVNPLALALRRNPPGISYHSVSQAVVHFDLALTILRVASEPDAMAGAWPPLSAFTPLFEARMFSELRYEAHIGLEGVLTAQRVEVAGPCEGRGDARLTCANCRSVRYCSKEHQRSHWKIHKKQCFKRIWGTHF